MSKDNPISESPSTISFTRRSYMRKWREDARMLPSYALVKVRSQVWDKNFLRCEECENRH